VLFGLFALLALVLLAAGIYGVMSFQVAQRTHEIGIRMALGAERRGVIGMVLSRGMRLAAFGIAIGLVGALITSGITGAMLYRVSPLSPLSIVATGVLLALVGLLSSTAPALRATAVDPIRAMQAE
jgi:putative ABC transport system permease protein